MKVQFNENKSVTLVCKCQKDRDFKKLCEEEGSIDCYQGDARELPLRSMFRNCERWKSKDPDYAGEITCIGIGKGEFGFYYTTERGEMFSIPLGKDEIEGLEPCEVRIHGWGDEGELTVSKGELPAETKENLFRLIESHLEDEWECEQGADGTVDVTQADDGFLLKFNIDYHDQDSDWFELTWAHG